MYRYFFATFFGSEVWWQMVGGRGNLSIEEGVAVIQAEDHKCLDEHWGCLSSSRGVRYSCSIW